jgi:branched-chain amino acid transport system permease protein
VYFVVFTFGLTELVHQVVNWWAIRSRTVTRYIFTDVTNVEIYETLLAITVLAIAASWVASRTRLGYTLRAIGEDETVARHTGIDTTRVKVLCFAASAAVMALVGAVLTLQYPYVDASIAFNNTWSFEVLIAALLGGPGRPWGPALGAIPLVLLKDQLAGSLYFTVALGLCFVAVVYVLPGGVAPLIERRCHAFDATSALHVVRAGRLPDSRARPRRLKLGMKARLARFNGHRRL